MYKIAIMAMAFAAMAVTGFVVLTTGPYNPFLITDGNAAQIAKDMRSTVRAAPAAMARILRDSPIGKRHCPTDDCPHRPMTKQATHGTTPTTILPA